MKLPKTTTSLILAALFVVAQPVFASVSHVRCESFLRDRLPIGTSVAHYKSILADPVQTKLALSDAHKWEAAHKLLERELSDAEKIALTVVYDSAKGQLDASGNAAGAYYDESRFTPRQLGIKEKVLRAAGFGEPEIARLLRTPLVLGPDSTQNDQIRLAVRRLKARRSRGLEKLEAAVLDDGHMRRLPRWKGKGELPHLAALTRIQVLFGNTLLPELFAHMEALELEVMVRTVEKRQSGEKSLQEVLERWENAHGFAPASELEPRVYTSKEFRAELRKGALPKDPGLSDPFNLGGGYHSLEFAAHGYDTHRVQWNVVMRDMRKNPEHFRSLGEHPRASDLYRFLGEEMLMKKLDWTGTGFNGFLLDRDGTTFPGSRTLWDALFEGDGFQHDFHTPIFVRKLINDERHMIWPALYNLFQ